MTIISSILTALCILGSYLNAKKLIVCFVVWTFCNIGWGIIDFVSGNYPRCVLDAVQLALSIYGLWEWRNQSQK